MLVSRYFLPTTKETPADAELISHQYMLRAGLIRKSASGLYSWLPLGLRVLQKVEAVVRDEMNKAGALELSMPVVQAAELWHESGRWEQYGKELLRFTDRHERDFCLGPTHEEVITDIMRNDLKSYKQLPLNVYQIQTKFRDEIRPRFGVMRAREFMMKDAYSFHADKACMEAVYNKMYEAYTNIFTRLGLDFRAVLADSGAIGGDMSHEFQVLAKAGEDVIAYSDGSDYAANIERASALPAQSDQAKSLRVKKWLVKGVEEPLIAVILREDHELNETKAQKHPAIATPLTITAEPEILASTDLGKLKMPCIIDCDAAAIIGTASSETADLRNVVEGDISPDGQGVLKFARGIEVGHIFQLGDKYSKSMHLTVLTENGKAAHPLMGCYGIGVSRVVAAAIEQNHDDIGIVWPEPMAPFKVAITPIQMHKSYRVREYAEKLYDELLAAGVEVLFDDRKERPGVMFATMDLIGIPHRVVIGERGLDDGTVEYKNRKTGEVEHIQLDKLKDFLLGLV